MGRVKRAKTCIASEFSDALDTLGCLLKSSGMLWTCQEWWWMM
jgi:hypothetical protein